MDKLGSRAVPNLFYLLHTQLDEKNEDEEAQMFCAYEDDADGLSLSTFHFHFDMI